MNYGKLINQFPPDNIKSIRQQESINTKICRQKYLYCLIKYIYIYIYIYLYDICICGIYIFIYIYSVCCIHMGSIYIYIYIYSHQQTDLFDSIRTHQCG